MYIKILKTGTIIFPYEISELYKTNPQVSFPETLPIEILNNYDVYKVQDTPAPTIDNKVHYLTQKIDIVNGEYVHVWDINQLPVERASSNVRAYRDKLLRQTDWRAVSDRVMTEDWVVYRQTLRDITQQDGFPYNIIWPEPPTN